MATLRTLKEPLKNELAAVTYLQSKLPAEDIITTPVRDVDGREIDGVYLSTRGILALEYKSFAGLCAPQSYGAWKRNGKPDAKMGKNPLEQADLAAKKLKSYLAKRTVTETLPCFVDYVIILSHPKSSLDLSGIGPDSKDAQRICLLKDAPEAIRRLLRREVVFSSEDLELLADSLANPSAGKITLTAPKNEDDNESEIDWRAEVAHSFAVLEAVRSSA